MITPRLGFYKVGTEIFADKTPAVLRASQLNQPIEWNFHQDVFNKIDWKTEPETGLDEFYRMRAQQIRDEFDYVIVLCSGGGDSTNVIWSFLRNRIKVDEVIAGAPFSGLFNWQASNKDKSASNTISETFYVQIPLVQEIHEFDPSIRITLHDYFENMLNYKTDDWLLRSGDWIHPTSAARYDFENHKHIVDLAESGKKIAIVYGIDKPLLLINKENNIEFVFNDLAVNVQRPPFKKWYPNVENVLFYYTPDMPLMMVKQSHALSKWIFRPEQARTVLPWVLDQRVTKIQTFEQNRFRHSVYERAIIPCLYPSTHRPVFQGHKPTRLFLGEHDDWFYKLHHNTRVYEMIDSDFRNFYKMIDPKFLNERKTGYKIERFTYVIGSVDQFKPNQNVIL